MDPPVLARLLAVALGLAAVAAFDGVAFVLAALVAATIFALAPRISAVRPPPFRVEHRGSGWARVVAGAADERAGRATLEALADRLARAGWAGTLVLVERASGRVVAWRVLASARCDLSAGNRGHGGTRRACP